MQYSVADAGLAYLSVFFMQCHHFGVSAAHAGKRRGTTTRRPCLGVHAIPCDNQIRHLLDAVPPQALEPLYEELLQCLMREVCGGHRTLNNKVLLALDGVTYFSSTTLHCRSAHSATTQGARCTATPPSPLCWSRRIRAKWWPWPQFITPQDGQTKQDCRAQARLSLAAAPRATLGPVRCGGAGRRSVLPPAVLPGPAQQGLTRCWCANPTHTHHRRVVADARTHGDVHAQAAPQSWAQGLSGLLPLARHALRDGEDALSVDWCELTTTDGAGKTLYRNSFASSLSVSADNVREIVAARARAGRSRTRTTTPLKTKGYRFEHNFGHGQQHLSATLASMIMLALLAAHPA